MSKRPATTPTTQNKRSRSEPSDEKLVEAIENLLLKAATAGRFKVSSLNFGQDHSMTQIILKQHLAYQYQFTMSDPPRVVDTIVRHGDTFTVTLSNCCKVSGVFPEKERLCDQVRDLLLQREESFQRDKICGIFRDKHEKSKQLQHKCDKCGLTGPHQTFGSFLCIDPIDSEPPVRPSKPSKWSRIEGKGALSSFETTVNEEYNTEMEAYNTEMEAYKKKMEAYTKLCNDKFFASVREGKKKSNEFESKFSALTKQLFSSGKPEPECGGKLVFEIKKKSIKYRCTKCDDTMDGYYVVRGTEALRCERKGWRNSSYKIKLKLEPELVKSTRCPEGVIERSPYERGTIDEIVYVNGHAHLRCRNSYLPKPEWLRVWRFADLCYPVSLRWIQGESIFKLLKSATSDPEIASKINAAIDFLKCSGEEYDQGRDKEWKKINTSLFREKKKKEKRLCGFTVRCELCDHEKEDPSFIIQRQNMTTALNEAKVHGLNGKGAPVLNVYRTLVEDFPDADHSTAGLDELLDRYLKEVIRARDWKRVGKHVYEGVRPLCLLKSVSTHVSILYRLNQISSKKAIGRLKSVWPETPATVGYAFNNGYVDQQGVFHGEHVLCSAYIDMDFTPVQPTTDYDDLHPFTPIDKHLIYAALGAALLDGETWRIQFEKQPTLQCPADEKKLFADMCTRLYGADMVVPAFACTLTFTRLKCIQSYVLLKQYGWRQFMRQGDSRISERLQYKPDLLAEFIRQHLRDGAVCFRFLWTLQLCAHQF